MKQESEFSHNKDDDKQNDDDWGGKGNKDIYKKDFLVVERGTPTYYNPIGRFPT